jgi:hypothetical protein
MLTYLGEIGSVYLNMIKRNVGDSGISLIIVQSWLDIVIDLRRETDFREGLRLIYSYLVKTREQCMYRPGSTASRSEASLSVVNTIKYVHRELRDHMDLLVGQQCVFNEVSICYILELVARINRLTEENRLFRLEAARRVSLDHAYAGPGPSSSRKLPRTTLDILESEQEQSATLRGIIGKVTRVLYQVRADHKKLSEERWTKEVISSTLTIVIREVGDVLSELYTLPGSTPTVMCVRPTPQEEEEIIDEMQEEELEDLFDMTSDEIADQLLGEGPRPE